MGRYDRPHVGRGQPPRTFSDSRRVEGEDMAGQFFGLFPAAGDVHLVDQGAMRLPAGLV